MLGKSENNFLVITNLIDKKGEILSHTIGLPLNNADLDLPRDIVQASLLEICRNEDGSIVNSFNIYIGEVSTLHKIMSTNHNLVTSDNLIDIGRIAIDKPICCYLDENDNYVVQAELSDQDLVVEDYDEFIEKVLDISEDYKRAINGINRIKKLIYKK